MRLDKYTVMFIPEGEARTHSYHFSKNIFLFIITSILIIILCALGTMVYFIPRISDYTLIKKRNDEFMAERTKILELTRDLERIKQMDELVRASLGTTLDIDPKPVIIDSSAGILKLPNRQVSYIENIPSLAPIAGYISQRSINEGLFIKESHNGIDIVAKEGEPILASASGVVVFSGWTYEFGNMIILYHGDDYFTHYGHNKQNLKKQLDIVSRGEVIGLVGSTGMSSGPHLHFEIWREFIAVDPLIYFPEYKTYDLTSLNE